MNKIDREKVSDSPLLVALSSEQVENFLQDGIVEHYEDGNTIVRRGSIGDALYLILSGNVLISAFEDAPLTHLSGDDTLHAQYEGDFFGEMSILDHEPRAATVTSVGQTILYKISKDRLHDLFNADLEFHVVLLTNISRTLSRRLRNTNQRMMKLRENG